jgi:hypothetical protein
LTSRLKKEAIQGEEKFFLSEFKLYLFFLKELAKRRLRTVNMDTKTFLLAS